MAGHANTVDRVSIPLTSSFKGKCFKYQLIMNLLIEIFSLSIKKVELDGTN